MLITSGYFQLQPWKASVDLGRKYNVPVYPCLSESRIDPGKLAPRKVRNEIESYRERAAEIWPAGGDGVYLFNSFNCFGPESSVWHELGNPKVLQSLDKTYFACVRTRRTRGHGSADSYMPLAKVAPLIRLPRCLLITRRRSHRTNRLRFRWLSVTTCGKPKHSERSRRRSFVWKLRTW